MRVEQLLVELHRMAVNAGRVLALLAVNAWRVLAPPARHVETIALERRAHHVRLAIGVHIEERVCECGGTGHRIGQPYSGCSLSGERLRSRLFPGDRRDWVAIIEIDLDRGIRVCGVLLPALGRPWVYLRPEQPDDLRCRVAA